MLCSKKEKMDNLENDEHGTCCGTLFLSFLAGAAVGAGLSLLYAPKTGKELREKIGELTDDAVDKIKTYATEAQEKIKSTIEDSKEVIKEKKTILTSAIEAGKEAMEREKDKYRDKEAQHTL
jgi:gas vesicle protein